MYAPHTYTYIHTNIYVCTDIYMWTCICTSLFVLIFVNLCLCVCARGVGGGGFDGWWGSKGSSRVAYTRALSLLYAVLLTPSTLHSSRVPSVALSQSLTHAHMHTRTYAHKRAHTRTHPHRGFATLVCVCIWVCVLIVATHSNIR